MVVTQPSFGISAWFLVFETFVFLLDLKVVAVEVFACYGTTRNCTSYSMNCPDDLRIQVDKLQNGRNNGTDESCENDNRYKCTDGLFTCCVKGSHKCIEDFSEARAEGVRKNCSGKSSCGPFLVDHVAFITSDKCTSRFSTYVIVNYSCVRATVTNEQLTSTSHGLASSGNAPSSSESSDGISVPTIVGVVIATIIVIAVVSVAFIIFKRQRKKETKKDDKQIADLPKVLTNYTYEKSMEITEPSNYDTISDDSVLNYSLPEKIKKDPRTIPVTVNKYDDISAEKYDKIKFEMKSAVKAPDYDHLAAVKENEDYQYSPVSNQSKQEDYQYSTTPNQSKQEDSQYSHIPNQSKEEDYQYSHIPNQSKEEDNQYSHISNQSNSFTSDTAAINDYSLCKPKRNDASRNGDDYTHIEFEKDDTTNLESNISEANPYNHIVLDDSKEQMQNGTAAKRDTRSESNYPISTVIESCDIVNI